MPDISMCDNKQCPLRFKCYRFTATPNPYRQSFGNFEYDEKKEKCEYFWDNKEYRNEKVN